MEDRSVRFQEFKMKQLAEGEAECRKIKANIRLSGP